MLSNQRGVIDIIFGDVLVVLARFRATDVVTLRCKRLSDILFFHNEKGIGAGFYKFR